MPRFGKLLTIKSLRQYGAIALLPLALSHCASHRVIPFPETPNNPGMATVNTSDVTQVVLSGHIQLNLATKPNHQHLTFKMPSDAHASSYVYVQNHTLYINNNGHRGMPRHYNLTIGKDLKLLSTHGNVSVTANDLKTHELTIIDGSGGKVTLNGQVDVQRIYASQHSHLNIVWANTPELVIYANDHAHIHLGGVTKNMFIHMTGDSLLDAQYLRANNITIDSAGYSQAHLFPLNSFQGFAHQGSTIYLYHAPHHKNQHTWEGANIFMKSYRP